MAKQKRKRTMRDKIYGACDGAGILVGIAAGIAAGQAFGAVVPEANTEIANVVRKIGKWGITFWVEDQVSDTISNNARDLADCIMDSIEANNKTLEELKTQTN